MRSFINIVENAGNASLGEKVRMFFTHKGFKIISAGAYGRVYGNDKANYVIKVFRSDPCYENFLRLLIDNPNPYFPKVLSQPKSLNQLDKMVMLERLYPASDANIKRVVDLYLSVFVQYSDFDSNPTKAAEMRSDALTRMGLSEDDDLVRALALIYKGLDENNICFIDLAGRNIMQRHDGSPVITDPAAPK